MPKVRWECSITALYCTAISNRDNTSSWSQVISQDSIMINVEAGKVYFVNGEAKMGVVAGRPKFTQMDEGTGRARVAKL
jgi:hypothetical protein